jgi:hypothetical protein
MSQQIAAAGGTTYSDIADTTKVRPMADRHILLLIRSRVKGQNQETACGHNND